MRKLLDEKDLALVHGGAGQEDPENPKQKKELGRPWGEGWGEEGYWR